MRGSRTIRTKRTRKKFLLVLSEGGSPSAAASACGIGRQSVYDWRHDEKEFAAEWDAAVEHATDLLEDEAWRRGRDGVRKPVFHRGVICGYIKEYSDPILLRLLAARRREKFGADVEGGGGGEHTIKIINVPPGVQDKK